MTQKPPTQRLNLKNLCTPAPATIVMWLVVALLLAGVVQQAIYAVRGHEVTFVPSTGAQATALVTLAGVILAYFLVVLDDPSLQRWLSFGLVTLLDLTIIQAVRNTPWVPVTYTVTASDVVHSMGSMLFICAPLVLLRAFPTRRRATEQAQRATA